ncbi:MAG: serine/threonine-protein kinase [Acidobacteria bacterium]|nr:serine/threonine-protein kinase [Acidobacteriota bacterium]
MAHATGDRLGPYEIVAPIGAGGMGEVYKARDTRLDRTVAIKVLPDHIAKRGDLLARFEREARAVASLNHPNICTLYDIGPGYMVMELIEGETLSARIAKGPIPLDQALPFALQIADALDRAHRAGVTHRDVKPPNIMLTRDGVKILDFGLAKSQAKPGPTEETLTAVLTTEGTIMGTPQYMAPEQFAGKEADASSDIWAFGAVLYEMVTGRKAFTGSNYQSLVGAILATEPPPMAVKPFTPAWLERMVRRCLAKEPDDRWQSMRDIVLELRTPPAESVAAEPVKAARWPWIATAASLCLAVGIAFIHFRQTPPAQQSFRYEFKVPEGANTTQVAISPDGRLVAISGRVGGKYQLWLRALDELDARPIPFSEDDRFPFWSPDGRYIGFFAQEKLKKVAVSGGPAQTICEARIGRGGTWSRNDVIAFVPAPGAGLLQVSASGGVPKEVGGVEGEARGPVFLPDGRRLLYLRRGANEKSGIYVGSLDGKENRRLLPDVATAVFAPGAEMDHILFARDRILMALPFDAESAQPTGEAFPLFEAAVVGAEATTRVTASSTGVLLAQRGRVFQRSRLVWFDRAGKKLGAVSETGEIFDPALSPDEKRLAFVRSRVAEDLTAGELWVRDLNRGSETKLPTENASVRGLAWSPNGDRIVYGLDRAGEGVSRLLQRPSDGSGREEVLISNGPQKTVTQWSRDGKFILYSVRQGPETQWALSMETGAGERKPMPIAEKVSYAMFGQISPDGRWIAFTGRQTGRREVYVRPFPSGEGEWVVSVAGGHASRWRADGKELFFVDMDGRVMAAPVKALSGPKPVFEAGTPSVLFESNMALTGENNRPLYQYDVTADGQRFLILEGDGSDRAEAPYVVVTNWQASVKK